VRSVTGKIWDLLISEVAVEAKQGDGPFVAMWRAWRASR
jgi:hypothetical protein